MSRGSRLLLAALLCGCACLVAGAGGLAAAVARAGTVGVHVQGGGDDVRVAVPAVLVHLAIALVPAAALDDVPREAKAALPALAAACARLEDTPDFTLVEVASPGERLRIDKRGGRMVVLVDSPGTRVEVGVPLRTMRALLDKLAV
jgi:hypothetical protein